MISPSRADSFFAELDRILAHGPDRALAAMQLIAKHFDHFQWVGIYWLDRTHLTLGPYVGPATEHCRIAVGQGVCGTAIAEGRNQVIPDVREITNYLACSTTTRAEIVVLIRHNGEVIGQIDADSDQVGAFDATDEALLAAVAERLAAYGPLNL